MGDDVARDEIKIDQDQVVWREVEGETIVLQLDRSVYLKLNGSGTVLWREMLDGVSRPELVDRLIGEFGVDRERARVDVDGFIEVCRHHGLIQ